MNSKLVRHLANYAEYHRDKRNLATHFVGIPLIVLGIAGLLARPRVIALGLPFSPVVLVALGAVLFYLSLDLRFAVVMAVLFGGAVAFGTTLAGSTTGVWLVVALSLFIVGWAFQLVGHVMEGRKPAFVDDILGLLVGPLFLVVEVALKLGLRQELRPAMSPKRD